MDNLKLQFPSFEPSQEYHNAIENATNAEEIAKAGEMESIRFKKRNNTENE